MFRAIARVMGAALLGCMAGSLLLTLTYPFHSQLAIEMDRELPSFVSGFHPIERADERTFVWTSGQAVVRLRGLDRRPAWTCTFHVRGAREPGVALPELTVVFDGTKSHTTRLTNEFEDVALEVPRRPDRSGLTLTAFVSPTFVPGNGDSRVLGAQVDWIRCTPTGWAWPPASAMAASGLGAAAFAAAAAAAGAPLAWVGLVTAGVGVGQALLLSTGGGAFGTYPSAVLWMAVVIAGIGAGVARGLQWSCRPLSAHGLVALAGSAAVAFLKLAALTHPGKPLIDGLFQAHRLEWVLAGRYFFTQPLPDGVAFPYAIGLYVMAAPWTSVFSDYVLLLRAVVVAAEAMAGLLLYAVVARAMSNRLAGVIALLLFHVIPLPYTVIGNANLTNAFAEAVALMAVTVIALLAGRPERQSRWMLVALTALTALAFLSHVSTLALLAGTIAVIAGMYLVFGTGPLRRLGMTLVVTTLVAALLSIGLYYRHFTEVYAHALSRVRVSEPAPESQTPSVDAPAVLVRPLAWHERASDSVKQTTANLGWPVILLAAVGAWHVWRRQWRAPIPLLLAAWCVAWLAFLFVGTLTRVDTQYQRYAAEFVGRVNLASYPAAAVLGGIGAAAMIRTWPRIWSWCGIALLTAAAATGAAWWFRWFS